jgi:uncharacterized membrane protein
MGINFNNVVLLLTIFVVALMAGLFYNWSTAITTGLHRLDDKEYLSAMQSINRTIQNPWFFLSFFGVIVLLPLCTYLQYKGEIKFNFYLTLFALIIYFTGVMLVTISINIPLNNMLDAFDINNAKLNDIVNMRKAFETKWNSYNMIRTISSIISLILLLLACINKK